MKARTADNFISKLLNWVIVLSVFSYPATAVLILQSGLPGSSTNFIIRIVLSVLYVILLFSAVLKGGRKWSIRLLPLIAFLILYSFRLIFDISIRGVQILEYTNFYVYSYYFGLILLPCFAIISARKFIDFEHLIRLSFYFLILSNVLLIYQMLMQGEQLSFVDILATRAQSRVEGKNRAFINPIVVGFFGSNLSLLSLSPLIIKRRSFLKTMLFLATFCIGIVNLLFGASRGPFIVFVLLLLTILLYYYTHERNRIKLFFRTGIVVSILAAISWKYIIPFLSSTDIFLFKRFELFFDGRASGHKEVRDYAYESAWNDFLESPVWGKQYVGTYDNFYPHNIPLEVLMSTGMIGFVLFALICLSYFYAFIKLYTHKENSPILIVLILSAISFLAGLTSGSIFFTPNFWILIVVAILTITNYEYSRSH